MKTIRSFIESHPVLSYYATVFAISRGGFVLAVGQPDAIPATKEQFTTLPLLAILAVLVGPSASGLLLTSLVYGGRAFATSSPR